MKEQHIGHSPIPEFIVEILLVKLKFKGRPTQGATNSRNEKGTDAGASFKILKGTSASKFCSGLGMTPESNRTRAPKRLPSAPSYCSTQTETYA